MAAQSENFITVHHRNVWGEWIFSFNGSKLCGLKYIKSKNDSKVTPSGVAACASTKAMPETSLNRKTALAYKKASTELNAYLCGKLQDFSVPISILGTDFQVQVWEEIRKIPYGETRTYKQIAEAIGHPHAERAVGNALHVNPLQLIIPCHRIVSSRGDLSGFALGLDLKRRLLVMEGAIPREFSLE